MPKEKHIKFSQIPFLIFGLKKPLKVENWIFQVFWGFKCKQHNFGKKKTFSEAGIDP